MTPLLQHNFSQLSGPVELILHSRPVVPKISFAGFFVQKSGLFEINTSFLPMSGFWWGLAFGVNSPVFRFELYLYVTRWAWRYFFIKSWPMISILGTSYQQVLDAQDPETPWHLHDNLREFFAASRPWALLCKFISIFAIFDWILSFLGTPRRENSLQSRSARVLSSELPRDRAGSLSAARQRRAFISK